MKLLIILFLTFSAFANYIPKTKVGTGESLTVFMKKKKCESHYSEICIKIPSGYNSEFHKLKDQMKNDLDSPNWGQRSAIEPCSGESNCSEIALIKECLDGRHSLYNAEYSEVWCNKILSYAQIPSGKKIVSENAELKAIHEADKLSKKLAKQALKDEIELLKVKLIDEQDLTPAELRKVLRHLVK